MDLIIRENKNYALVSEWRYALIILHVSLTVIIILEENVASSS